MRIDSHQHFWQIADHVGHWPPVELGQLQRDFTPADLQPALAAGAVSGTVAVQTMQSVADTRFLLELADRHPSILGVVGWVDLKAADAPSVIAELARHPRLKGLRPALQDIPDLDWIDDEALDPAVAAMTRHGLSLDALVTPDHLPALLAFVRRHPALPVVIDHAAKPRIASGAFVDWRHKMATLALQPGVHVKLSGLLTEAGDRPGLAAIRPYVETILDLFGPQRTLWGSDWPVLLLAGNYSSWLAMCLELVPPDQHDAVFASNARRFYRLD